MHGGFEPGLFGAVFLRAGIASGISPAAGQACPYIIRKRGLILQIAPAVDSPLIGHKHAFKPDRQPDFPLVSGGMPLSDFNRNIERNPSLVGIETDVNLRFVAVVVRQRDEQPPAALLHRQIDAVVRIPVPFGSGRKTVRCIGVRPVEMTSHLSAQILIQPAGVHARADGLVALFPTARQVRFAPREDRLKAAALLHDKPQIMPVLLREVRVAADIFLNPALCASPLAFDIPQRVKYG